MLRERLGQNLIKITVFGSVARGTATPESDIDILLLVRAKDAQVRDIASESALDVNLKYDVVIAPVIMTEDQYSNPLFHETLFFKNLEQEGVPL